MFVFSDYRYIIGQFRDILDYKRKHKGKVYSYHGVSNWNFVKKYNFHVNHGEYMLDFIQCINKGASSKGKQSQKRIKKQMFYNQSIKKIILE